MSERPSQAEIDEANASHAQELFQQQMEEAYKRCKQYAGGIDRESFFQGYEELASELSAMKQALEAAEARIKASQEQEHVAYIVPDYKLGHPVLCWANNTSVSYDNSITIKEPIALYLAAAPQPGDSNE